VTLTAVSGYDVGNTANIQVPVYESMGHIELLPWVASSFSMASFAFTPLIRRMGNIFDFRTCMLTALVIVNVGAAVTGSAQSMSAFIAGRVVNGIGSAGTYQM